jgi:hypothetical protein
LKPYQNAQYSFGETLNFRVGEKILIEKTSGNEKEGWIYGSIGATRKGWFPANLVKIEEHII